MRMIYTDYDPLTNSIDVTTFENYILWIDCNKAEDGLNTTPCSQNSLNTLAIDESTAGIGWQNISIKDLRKYPLTLKVSVKSAYSPSLEAAILNAKYVNAVPLYRQEKEFERYGINITRKNMADWTIRCAERYLAILYDCLHEKLYGCHVKQADETPVRVNHDGRPAGSKSYMWVYRSGRMCRDTPIVLYDYQRTRNASHPREFLKDLKGVSASRLGIRSTTR